MRHIMHGLLLWMLIFPIMAQAQSTSVDDGCSPEVVERFSSITDKIGYQSICQTYRECDPSSNSDVLCQFLAFQTMTEMCEGDDILCHDGAFLMAAAIHAYPQSFWDESIQQTVIDTMPSALEAFWRGDDEEALEAFQSMMIADGNATDLMMLLAQATLYTRLNQPEAALEVYEQALQDSSIHPLILYARSQLYASLGRMDEAAIDIAVMASYLDYDPRFSELMGQLESQYPLDNTVMEDWLLYPVADRSNGIGADLIRDESLASPRPIQLWRFEDLNLIAAIDLGDDNREDIHIMKVLRGDETATTFTFFYPTYYNPFGDLVNSEGRMTLTADGDVFSGRDFRYGFEWSGTYTFMIAPSDAPDPRLILDDERYCEGGIRTRIHVGDVVGNIYQLLDYSLNLYDQPDGNLLASVPNEPWMTVIDGPQCVDGVLWWQGEYHCGNFVGWFPEHDDTLYIAEVFDKESLPESFPSLPSRLRVGITGMVIAGLDANNMHYFASTDAQVMMPIPSGDTFDIIGGPECRDDMIWWNVEYGGDHGWIAEGQDDTYWLQPLE